MNSASILKYKRIFLTLFALMSIAGLVSWFTMPKEEDPQLSERFGFVQLVYPGATPVEVERFLVAPLIEALSEISEVKKLDSTIRSEFALIQIELTDSTDSKTETNEAWTDIQNIVAQEASEFPEGVLAPEVNKKALDQDAIVIALIGTNRLAAKDYAEKLEKELLRIPTVTKVRYLSDPGKQVSVTLNESKMRRIGLSRSQLISQIQRANQISPGGAIKVQNNKVNISTNSSFKSLQDLSALSLILPSGEPMALLEVAQVELTEKLPKEEAMRVNGKVSLGLGVVPAREIDLIQFGERVRAAVTKFQEQNPSEVKSEFISFQPGNVSSRLLGLGFSLAVGIATVSILLILLMGWRMGTITSLLIPVISLAALSVYSLMGGVLHQISISAFVLSLGLLVDNIIVVIESVQEKMDQGSRSFEAALETIDELALPLLAATGTTVASFLPMLGSTGSTADFTRAIPTIAVLTLSISYLFSIFVTPSLGQMLLRKSQSNSNQTLTKVGVWISLRVWEHPRKVIAFAFILLAISGATSSLVKNKFFPNADRNQLVLEARFSESTHFEYTDQRVQELEQVVQKLPHVNRVSTFVGRGTPRFFYNLGRVPNAPFVAQMIVEYENFDYARDGLTSLQEVSEQTLPDAFVIAKPLEQGPPTLAPIEIQILSSSYDQAVLEYPKVLQALQSTPGARKVRADVGAGILKYDLVTNDYNASQYQFSRSDLARTLLSKTRGLPIGRFRATEDNDINIVIRSPKGQSSTELDLKNTFVAPTQTGSLSIADFSKLQVDFEPSVLRKRKNAYVIRVLSELEPGYDFSDVLAPALAKIRKDIDNPAVEVKIGGAAEESETANTAIFKVMPIGIMLLLISLLVQFNSFKKIFIILTTIPLIFAGVFPALLLSQQPFSFFSLLGVLALIGIVVNTGILIVDRIDSNLQNQLQLQAAVQEAIVRRLRPILLTTITTIAGLMPLALTSATLWPPFAWAMIGGLLASTLLALAVVPSLYILIYSRQESRPKNELSTTTGRTALSATQGALLMGFLVATQLTSSPAKAQQTMDIEAVIRLAENRPKLISSQAELLSLKRLLSAQRGAAYLPKVGGEFQRFYRDREFELETPIGTFPLTQRWNSQASLVATQPVLDLSNMNYKVEEIDLQVKARAAATDRIRKQVKFAAAHAYLDILIFQNQLNTTQDLNKNLKSRRSEIARLYDLGRVTNLDRQKIAIAIDESEQQIFAIEQQIHVLKKRLAQFIGQEEAIEVNKGSLTSFSERIVDLKPQTSRKDLEALSLTTASKRASVAGARSNYLPTVALQGRYIYDSPGQFRQNEWYEVGVIAKWNLFSGNTRHHQLQARKLELKAASQREAETKLAIEVEQASAQANLTSLEREAAVRKRSYQRAKTVARQERTRYRNGKSSLNDLIDAETLLTETNGKLESFAFELLKSKLDNMLANGGEI